MIKMKGKYFPGRPGVNFYSWNGIECARSNAKRVFMSTSMLDHQKLIGKTTRMGASIRSLLQDVLPDPKDVAMHTRLRQALRRRYINAPTLEYGEDLENFAFNPTANLGQLFRVPMDVSSTADNLLVHIPSFVPIEQVSAPAGTIRIEMLFTAATCTTDLALPVSKAHEVFNINYADEPTKEQYLALPISSQPHTLTLLVASCKYYSAVRQIERVKYAVCTVVHLVHQV
ncbi:hypothetical protein [Aridibaculum aurantiacum]|uniref:hypothetical protein n=1 Tax=Aridibaculum aurantiacum TaxID=2810307 RepID=UPI001A97412F|nr:hypothetical protein [Aridibaculum aurantiacum]